MKRPGHLKIYLGYAAGVGKTYRMLDEAQALRAEGVDVVVGLFRNPRPQGNRSMLEGLEILPPQELDYGAPPSRRFDIDSALKRKPGLCWWMNWPTPTPPVPGI